jgi:hypothetical protein
MLIHFKNIDGKNIAKTEVEIPDQVLNHFPMCTTSEGSTLNIPHVRNGAFTCAMGNAPLRFLEEPDKLTMPSKEYKGIHVNIPNDYLTRLGFESRGAAYFWHPALGDDTMTNWILFDINTDDISSLIFKTFNKGWEQKGIKARTLIKKALNDI